MTLLIEFLAENYVSLIMLIGMYILTRFDVFLEQKVIRMLRWMIGLLCILIAADFAETQFGNLDHLTVWRKLLSAVCYSLRPVIVLMLVTIIQKRVKKRLLIPAVLNIIAAFSVFFTDIVYSFSDDNHFQRGPLTAVPYIATANYVLVLFQVSFHVLAKRTTEEGWIVLFLALAATFAFLLSWKGHSEVTNATYTAELLLYYLYIYSQYTMRDALTGLLNRQSFYSDLEKRQNAITGVVSIDMNELKWINDSQGHAAGDRALTAIAEALQQPLSGRESLYRTGGDEFLMLCRAKCGEEIGALVEAMRKAVTAAGYSCAFGYCAEGSADEMLREADRLMYADKARIKAEVLANGGVLHSRK